MRRIDTATKATDLFGPGKHGFKDGDPGVGDLPTTLNAAWFNSTQEEICNVVEGAGLTIDPESHTQLLAAIRALLREVVPPGSIVEWPGAAAPAGWLLCQGQILLIAEHADLAAVLGTKYGGDGLTTFGVPDYRDRVPMGTSPTRPLGSTGGAAAAETSPGGSHNHGGTTGGTALTVGQIPPHAHYVTDPNVANTNGFDPPTNPNAALLRQNAGSMSSSDYALQYSSGAANTGLSSSAGGGATHDHTISAAGDHTHEVEIEPPHITTHFIIKV